MFVCDNFHGTNTIDEIDIHPLKRKLFIKDRGCTY